MLLEGKVAIVSGLGPGMGRDISLALAREGADIVMAARREDRMAAVAEEVEGLGRRAVCVRTDISSRVDCDRLAETVRRELGTAHILVNNAFHDGNYKSFEDSDLDEWKATFDVNLWGTLQLTKAVLPLLKEHEESHIVMINTMSVHLVEPNFGAYAASKGALATATRTLARELGRDGVRVNGIHPGYIWGSSVEWYLNHLAEQNGTSFEEEYAKVADQTCLGYIVPSSEIAGAVLFFSSSLSRAVTGQSLPVNGGHYLQ
ncbi:SDR family oxidoreductase [Rhabdothermincola sediminis]|uniref:SDR family oxidoreductase n=1 Tax=Rhabdothermincola sediminis TaxID=2751370 RepID=UPI001AA03D6D|nr:SDR family oxidoreductase [Rhabdothermincola sediminis]